MKFEVKSGDSYGYGISNYTKNFKLKLQSLGVFVEGDSYQIEIVCLEDLVKFSAGLYGKLGIDFKNNIIYLNFSTDVISNY